MNVCETCLFWEKVKWQEGFGYCNLFMLRPDELTPEGWPKPLLELHSQHGYSDVLTADKFGCVQHQPVQEDTKS